MKTSTLRTLAAVLVFVVVGAGLAFHTGTGTPSAFGIDWIASVCPLGILETWLAEKSIAPVGVLCAAIGVVIVLVLGRAFCGWLCPVPLLRRAFGGKKKADREVCDAKEEHAAALHDCASCGGCAEARQMAKKARFRLKTGRFDTRHGVLAASLLSAAVFGFPVFCIVCPVGLTFATFVCLWRLVQFNEGTWSLLVFPVILVLELVVLRKWCHRFCPLGALLSLIAKGNRTFLPTVDEGKCLQTAKGVDCHACFNACPEGIDLHDLAGSVPRSECTKCRACLDACPEKAISMPLLPKKAQKSSKKDLTDI